jgi:hypothetical protein
MSCSIPGCQMNSGGRCRLCGLGVAGPILQPQYTPGCICPPTSEKTCENPICPRQNPFKKNNPEIGPQS